MIHIEQNQKIPENPGLRVLSPTGDYSDVDLIECAPLDGDDIAVASLQAQFIKYGGMVYRYNEPEELGKAIYEIDKSSTHDSALLFAEDEARRLKRKAGTLIPENQVQADETVSATQKAKAVALDEESQPTPDGIDEGTLIDPKKNSDVVLPNSTATTTPAITPPTATTTPNIIPDAGSNTSTTTPVIDLGNGTTTPPVATTTAPFVPIDTGTTTPIGDIGTSTTTPIIDIGGSTTTPNVIDTIMSTTTPTIDTSMSTTTTEIVSPVLNTSTSTPPSEIIQDTVQSINSSNPIVAFAKKQISRKLGL